MEVLGAGRSLGSAGGKAARLGACSARHGGRELSAGRGLRCQAARAPPPAR